MKRLIIFIVVAAMTFALITHYSAQNARITIRTRLDRIEEVLSQ